MRPSRIAMACLAMLVVVFACDDRPGAERLQGVDGFMAAGGPTPPECDTKSLPTRDYFQDNDDVKVANSLLRDLSDACDSDDQASAFDIGFNLLGMIEKARPPAAEAAVFSAGGTLVAGIWSVMTSTPGDLCDLIISGVSCPIPNSTHAQWSLEPGGAFGVRSSADTEPVYSTSDPANPAAVRWGVEPDGDTWQVLEELPTGRALIYGYPNSRNTEDTGYESSGVGFNLSVTPWYATPTEDKYLLVGNCGEPGQHIPFVSHETNLLTPGPSPSYCNGVESTLALNFGTRVVRTASSLLPFWPQPLHAAAAGGSSGNAREFSPFYDWDIPADAETAISQPYGGPTTIGDPICFEPDCGPFTFDWYTEIEGLSLATLEKFRIFTRDNNGVTVDFKPGWKVVEGSGAQCTQTGRNEITCTSDRREGIGNPDQRIELQGLALIKSGVYSLCVESVYDPLGSGLNIAACTENFHVLP